MHEGLGTATTEASETVPPDINDDVDDTKLEFDLQNSQLCERSSVTYP